MYIFIRNHLPLIIFVVLIFICGVIFGAIAVRAVDYNLKQDLFEVFSNFMEDMEEMEYEKKELMVDSVKFNLFSIIIIWILGATLIFFFLIPVLVFFKGFMLGFTVGFLLNQYNFRGIMISFLTIFPQNLLIIPSYIVAGVMALSFSLRIFKHHRGYCRLEFSEFIIYSLQMLFLLLILLTGSAIESYISPVLFKLLLRFYEI